MRSWAFGIIRILYHRGWGFNFGRKNWSSGLGIFGLIGKLGFSRKELTGFLGAPKFLGVGETQVGRPKEQEGKPGWKAPFMGLGPGRAKGGVRPGKLGTSNNLNNGLLIKPRIQHTRFQLTFGGHFGTFHWFNLPGKKATVLNFGKAFGDQTFGRKPFRGFPKPPKGNFKKAAEVFYKFPPWESLGGIPGL